VRVREDLPVLPGAVPAPEDKARGTAADGYGDEQEGSAAGGLRDAGVQAGGEQDGRQSDPRNRLAAARRGRKHSNQTYFKPLEFEQSLAVLERVAQQNESATCKTMKEHFKSQNLQRGSMGANEIWRAKAAQTFALFLLKSFSYLDAEGFAFLATFVLAFAESLNATGWELLQRSNLAFSQASSDFCLANDCEHALEVSNVFVAEFLPRALEKYKAKSRQRLESDFDRNIKLTQHFTDWLYLNHFTDSKL